MYLASFVLFAFKLWLQGILIRSNIVYNALIGQSINISLLSWAIKIWQLRSRLLFGCNVRHFSISVSQRSPEDKRSTQRIINFTYTIYKQERLLEIDVCPLIMLVDYPQSLTDADRLGQGNLNLISEKSGKSQGIKLSIICGNPVLMVNSSLCVLFFQILWWRPRQFIWWSSCCFTL